ncbi:MAG TPA: glycoside hydrolase family 9 protein, partial [Abditibacterium sp.]
LIKRVSDGATVLSVPIGGVTYDADSGDLVRPIEFSALRESGTYRVEVPGVGASYPFSIGADVFARPFRLAMRSFYGQRCGIAVNMAPDFPGYSYPACHLDAAFHPSSGKTGPATAVGGWHDAGDYGRYIVNSGITTGTLLWAFELNEAKLKGINLDIPESGNAMPDMLDEIRWNIDWMLQMQDTDGGVWHKQTSAGFAGFVMPEQDKAPSLIIGNGVAPFKTTASTADFAAVCAIAGRVYRAYDAIYADKCLAAAKRAWTWLQTHPDNNYQQQPQGIVTGGYGDGNPSDERLWAAAELFHTTGEAEYNDYFLKNYTRWSPTLSATDAQGWGDLHNLAMYTYALSKHPLTDAVTVERIKKDAVAAADGIVRRTQANAYRNPMGTRDYIWGSTSVATNYAMMLGITYRFVPNPDYLNAAQDALHYVHGRNTFNTSFVTQVGTKWAMNPHHRPSGADTNAQPWPGMIMGGPNGNRRSLPARQWFDIQDDYTTNEMAINWNAPLVFVLAGALPDVKS